MKYFPEAHLPLFGLLVDVIKKNYIHSWQMKDFWKLAKRDYVLVNSNINYQNIYRLVQKLVKNGYLTINSERNEWSHTTYSETNLMENFRKNYCINDNESLKIISRHCEILNHSINNLIEESKTIEELKLELPELSYELNNLKILKNHECKKLTNRLTVLDSLLNSL